MRMRRSEAGYKDGAHSDSALEVLVVPGLLVSVVSSALLQEPVKAGSAGFLLNTEPTKEHVSAVRWGRGRVLQLLAA